MVAQRFLVPFVGVQIPVSLPLYGVSYVRGAFLFLAMPLMLGFSPAVFRFASRPVLSVAALPRNKSL